MSEHPAGEPVTAAGLQAWSALEEPGQWPRFLRLYARTGRARTRVAAVLSCDGQAVGRLSGEFVALDPARLPAASAT